MGVGLSAFGLTMTTATMVALLKIIAIDIVLSGDNAIVIAMATRNLPAKQQNKAILWGTAGAVILRVLFAMMIVWLLTIPYVNFIGGLLLFYIAYKVLVGEEKNKNISAQHNFLKAISTIVMADIVMSLDNVVAVAGAANGQMILVAIGVAISIPIMIFGSKFLVVVMQRYSWIGYAGAGILAWTAGEMIFKEEQLLVLLGINNDIVVNILILILTAFILLAGYIVNKKAMI